MIYAADLTYQEVRTQYVVPLVNELVQKSGLANVVNKLTSDPSSTSAVTETLFDDIAASKRGGCTLEMGYAAASSRCYHEIIEEASSLSVYMMPQELSLVAAVTTSCFLSFLLPQCNSAKFLRAYFEAKIQPLDERLATALESHIDTSTGLYLPSGPRNKSLIGEQDDLITSVPFYRFLEQGLGAFVSSGRAFVSDDKSKDNVSLMAGADLIRLLSMAIFPDPHSLNEHNKDEPEKEVDLLSSSTFPYSFHLVYADRVRLVKLCAQDLVVPENAGEDISEVGVAVNDDKKKLTSAIQGLRNSLLEFTSRAARSEEDACLAYKALVNILVRDGNPSTIKNEFKLLIDELLKSTSKEIVSTLSEALSDLVMRYNGSRYYADGEFTRDALIVLSNNIRERVANNDDGDAQQEQQAGESEPVTKRQKRECRPYHLIALMNVASSLFYFLLDIDVLKKMAGGALTQEGIDCARVEEEIKLQLMRHVSILLLYPEDKLVVKAAAELLALAFSYDEKYLADISNVKHIFLCTKKSIENWSSRGQNSTLAIIECLKGVIYTASRRSGTFAFNLLSYCAKEGPKLESVVSLISSVQPRVAVKVSANSTGVDHVGSIQQLLTLCSSTMTLEKKQLSFDSVEKLLKDESIDNWTSYHLVKHCFSTSNFGLAHQILEKHLMRKSLQQSSFLWLDSLIRLAAAEEMLRTDGFIALPDSLAKISACHSIILSLVNLSPEKGKEYQFSSLGIFQFQVEVLMARIEFLQLIKNARCTCTEYMLTLGHDSGNTRTRLHLKNLSRCFTMLASRYLKMYRIFGLHFSQQSRSALRGLISMCSFFSEIIDLVFFQKASVKNNSTKMDVEQEQELQSTVPSGDKNHPMGILLSRLRSGAAESKLSTNPIEPKALLDAIDVLLQCPLPFPSSFFVIKHIPMIYSTIVEANGQDIIDIAPGMPIKLLVTGVVPDSFTASAKTSFSQVVAWPTLSFAGRLDDDDEDPNETKSNEGNEMPVGLQNKPDAVATNLLPGGAFIINIELDPIMEEGYYNVNMLMGCRDICCGEWILPTQSEMNAVIRVTDT